MRPQQETAPHELYIRALSASKPNPTAPLKFYANVTGKFMIERKLGERVESVVRDKTAAAEKQRTERKTIMLDAPPPATVIKHPKKKPAVKKHPVVEAHSRTMSASSSVQPSRMASPRPMTLPTRDPQPSHLSPRPPPSHLAKDDTLRGRLIHFLALSPRSREDVMKIVGGVDDGSYRKDLLDLLKEVGCSRLACGICLTVLPQVAHPGVKNGTSTAAAPGPTRWLLNQTTWLEVRPFAFPDLSPIERRKLARKAQQAYEAMKIPQIDRRWSHIRPKESLGAESGRTTREPVKGDSNTAPSAGTSETRKSVVSQEQKARKAGPAESGSKTRDIDAYASKDESRPLRVEMIKRESEPSTSAAASMKPPARRLPGSGFKAKSGSNTPPTPELPPSTVDAHRKHASADLRPPVKQETHASSSNNVSRHAASLPPPPPRERRPSISSNASMTRVPGVSKESNEPPRAIDYARDRGRDSPAPPFGQKRKQGLRDEHESETSERETTGISKRRKVEESILERRKADEPSSERRKERDPTFPRKPPVREPSPPPPRPKPSKYEGSLSGRSPLPSMRSPATSISPLPPISSPLIPPRPAQHTRVPSVSSQHSRDERDEAHSHRSGSSKLKRRPVYTSSEDENENEPRRKLEPSQRDNRRETKKPARAIHRAILPEDPQGLKRVYARRFPIYESLYKRHVALIEEIKDLLKDGEDEVYLPDGDPGLPTHEQLADLRDELQDITEELNQIVDKYERLRRQGRTSDGPLVRPTE